MFTPRKRLVPALIGAAAAFSSLGIAATATPAGATTCSSTHNSTSAQAVCSGIPAGYWYRVRGRYSTGIFTSAYVYGPWYNNGVVSIAYHSNMNGDTVQTCAGGGC